MSKQIRRKYKLLVVLAVALVAGLGIFRPFAWDSAAADLSHLAVDFDELIGDDSSKYAYLSDVEPVVAQVGYGQFLRDKTGSGKITVRYDGEVVSFDKGLWAHANSNVYYDLEAVDAERKFDYLTAYIGLNTSSASGDGVKFYVYGSNDPEVANGQHLTGAQYWTTLYDPGEKVAMPGAEAEYLRLDVSEYRFVRLQAVGLQNITADHAVWADVKLAAADYAPKVLPGAAELDTELKAIGNLTPETNVGQELQVLRRDLLQNVGRYTLTQFASKSAEHRETLEWLYNNVDILRMYTTGGKPTGNYLASLETLNALYQEFKDTDLKDNTPLLTRAGHTRKEMYLRMVISLSLTHSKEVRFWIRDQGVMAGNAESPNISHPVDRYNVYKRMYLAGKLNANVFEQLEVEEMRYIMATELGDDELEWLRDWLPTIGKGLYAYPPVPYISIGSHYWYPENYPTDAAAQQALIDQYKLKGAAYTDGVDKTISGNYLIGFEASAPHLWMINKYGGVCWQISNFGQNMQASYGVPSTTFGQPGHLAFANYELGSNNIPAWALTNDVSGWAQTNYTGYTNINTYHQVRQLSNWGAADGSYALMNGKRYQHQGTYIVMAQAALNQFDKYEKSQVLVRTAEIYEDDLMKQAEVYERAIEELNINFDAWYGLLENYIAREGTEGRTAKQQAEEYQALAKRIAEALKRYPVPMYDLLQVIISRIPTNDVELAGVNMMTELTLTQALEWAAKATDAEGNTDYFRQTNVTRIMGGYLLGRLNNEVATFSFDGDEQTAGYIKLGKKYEASSAAFEYSVDGGVEWHGANGELWVTDKAVKLSDVELAAITAEKDILVHVQGVPREGNIYTIDIQQATLPTNLYANDLENRVVGVNMTMEWREYNGEEAGAWVKYKDSSPQRIGEVTMQVRVGATGKFLPSEPSEKFVFHEDTAASVRKYVPVSHLSVARVSSQATGGGQYGNAAYAIDGNINTRWHSAWNGSDNEKWVVIKFDHPVDLSAIEYVPAGGGNGRILQAEFYASSAEELNADDFALVGKVADNCDGAEVICQANWPNTNDEQVRQFEFAEKNDKDEWEYKPLKQVRYLAIRGTQTSTAGGGSFIAAKMFNFYEDRTGRNEPTASVVYSTTEATNGDVLARLVNPSTEIEVVSESNTDDPYTYNFTDNGSFTFKFRDKKTNVEGQAIAKVTWISKAAPTPRVEFVCAKGDLPEENEVEEIDCSGTRKVNRSVSAKLIFPDNAQVTILNNGVQQVEQGGGYGAVAPDPDATEDKTIKSEDGGGLSDDKDSLDPFTYLFMRNGEFTFEYVDAAGNYGKYPVWVDWIDKAAPKVTVEYDPAEETSGEVVARLVKVEGLGDDEYDENGYEYGEDFVVVNNDGSVEYRFTENGEFTFRYRDEEAGNYATATAKVDWIKPKTEEPDVPNPDKPDQPDPDNPKPDNPDNPDPDKPYQPDGPNISDTPEKPDDGTGNKPGNSGNPGASNPGTTAPGQVGGSLTGRLPGDTGSNDVAVTEPGGNDTGSSNRPGGSLTIEAVGLPENVKPQNRPLILNQAQKNQYGANSEFFRLEFVDEDGKVSEARPTEVKIKVNTDKKLKAVYIVKEDGTTERVEYEWADESHIVVRNPGAGDYLFEYEDTKQPVEVEKPELKDDEQKKAWYENPTWWVVGGIVAAVVVATGMAMANNRRR